MVKPPAGWAEDGMTDFFDQARHNQFATFHNFPSEYNLLKDLDDIFHRALDNLNNSSEWIPSFFFYRSHSTFRASCQLVMAGQIPESYMAMRGCLEFALYGIYFWRHPEDFETWCDRHESQKAKQKVRDKFTFGSLKKAVPELNPSDRAVVDHLYNLAIDRGAHPNPFALFGSLKKMEEADKDLWQTIYLTADSTHVQSALRNAAQFGATAFGLMSYVFNTRVSLAGLDKKFHKIKQRISATISQG